MPFKSEAQRRKFHAMAGRGEMSEATVHRWEHETPKKVKENLPYHKKKEAMFKLAQTAIAMNAFEHSKEEPENHIGSITVAAFLDELEKIAVKISPVLTSIPKIRAGVNPETLMGAGKSMVKTVAGKGAKAMEGTAAGVMPKALTGGTTFKPPSGPTGVTKTHIRPGASPSPAPAAGGGLRRSLAIGGGIGMAGMGAGYMMPHHQQQPQAR